MAWDPRTRNLKHRGWDELSLELEGEGAAWEYDNWLTQFEATQGKGTFDLITKGASLFNPVIGLGLQTLDTMVEDKKLENMKDDIDWDKFENFDTYEYETAQSNAIFEVQERMYDELFGSVAQAYMLHGSPYEKLDDKGKVIQEGWSRYVPWDT